MKMGLLFDSELLKFIAPTRSFARTAARRSVAVYPFVRI